MALTETALKPLKPKDKPYTLADERGLYVEVFPTGGLVWRFRYRLNGKQEKLTLGKYPALPMRHVHKARSRDRTLAPEQIRLFLTAAFASNIRRQFKIGLQLILLTMARKSELLLARWAHVDLEQAEWHIPPENSKTGKPHIVFLSCQSIALFKELHALAGGSQLVLPGRGSLTKTFAQNAINNALKKALQGQDIPAFTIHDMRRTASTLRHENGWSSDVDVVEKALNHTIGGAGGVYNRAEYETQRREMLQFWADYIEQLLTTGKVVAAHDAWVAMPLAGMTRKLSLLEGQLDDLGREIFSGR